MTAQPGLTRDRLEAAVAGFDSARLMTIHEFCAAMYDELGILATADPSGEVVTDLRPLAEQVARDLYLSRYAFDERQPPFALHDLKRDGVTTTGALSLADAALQHSLRPIVPAEAEGMIAETPPATRRLWRHLVVELVVGQRQDLTGTAARRRDLPFAHSVAILKSGRYTVQRPLELGAVIAGAPDSTRLAA